MQTNVCKYLRRVYLIVKLLRSVSAQKRIFNSSKKKKQYVCIWFWCKSIRTIETTTTNRTENKRTARCLHNAFRQNKLHIFNPTISWITASFFLVILNGFFGAVANRSLTTTTVCLWMPMEAASLQFLSNEFIIGIRFHSHNYVGSIGVNKNQTRSNLNVRTITIKQWQNMVHTFVHQFCQNALIIQILCPN